MTLIGIQDEYVATVNAAVSRWSHRPKLSHQVAGGHAGRTIHRARVTAEKRLRKLGFTDPRQIAVLIQDARDMAELERIADA